MRLSHCFFPVHQQPGFLTKTQVYFIKLVCPYIWKKNIYIYILSIGELGKHLYHIDKILSYLWDIAFE